MVDPAILVTRTANGRLPKGVRCFAIAATALLALSPVHYANAETLRDALISAYQYNPKLDAERARLRATDETVPQAKAGYRPRADLEGDAGRQSVHTKPGLSSDGTGNTAGYGVTVRQSLFSGFRTVNGVREAEANVRAGREQLRNVEQQTLLDAVTAYADVLRDQALVRLRENAVAVLTKDLQAAEARRAVREVTQTDVAQARARRARAVSQLDLARSNLRTSRAVYERVVGRPPNGLIEPTVPRRLLPPSVDEAIRTGEREHPNVVSALFREKAARHVVDKIWGELLPEARIEASRNHRFDPSRTIDEQSTTSISGRVNMPLYEGGETQARVRAAKHQHVARLQEVEQARGETQNGVVAAWARFQATEAQLRSDRVQVEAARTALEGTREEERVGQRTLLDVLNAEQELLDAEVQQVSTRRDVLVASFTLLAAIGRLNPDELRLGSAQYDPEAHYSEVTAKWWGVSITHRDGRREALDRIDDWGAEDPYAMRARPGSCEGLGRHCAEPAMQHDAVTADPLDVPSPRPRAAPRVKPATPDPVDQAPTTETEPQPALRLKPATDPASGETIAPGPVLRPKTIPPANAHPATGGPGPAPAHAPTQAFGKPATLTVERPAGTEPTGPQPQPQSPGLRRTRE